MRRILLASALLLSIGCSRNANGQDPGVGPSPRLPEPQRRLLPTVDIAPAERWPAGQAPTPAAGLEVVRFADGLQHPRWLHVLPNGDVLVAESNAPAGKSGFGGIRGAVMKRVMAKAGAGTPSADRITLLRDADGDGRAEFRSVFASGLHSPLGMALIGERFFIANADGLVVGRYTSGATVLGPVRPFAPLPGGGDEMNHHWTKSLVASADGKRLYVGVGSNSNVGENGMDAEIDRAAVLEIDAGSGQRRVYASGLRNPVGLAWAPRTGALWAVVNERDELGNDLVPDYLTAVEPGAFYGWPWFYWGDRADPRIRPAPGQRLPPVRTPDYGLGNHVAPLGLAFAHDAKLGPRFAEGAFVGLHGSWNRKPQTGYQVIFVPFVAGKPSGAAPVVVLQDFVDARGKARGRPVGVAIDASGQLLVADDVGNAVWRVRAR